MLRPAPLSASAWKYWPQSWYAVARADAVRTGRVLSGRLGGREWVLFRDASGCLKATDAFCPHMGAHLKAAKVAGNGLECGLHACQIVPQPQAGAVLPPIGSGCTVAVREWPCAERFGLVWLHPPADTVPPLPFEVADYLWGNAGPREIAADWRAMICNGFDLAHMRVVHQREVAGEPVFTRTAAGSLNMDYRTRILQRGGWSSWLMNRLSGGEVLLSHTCAGSSIMVHSRVGAFASCGIFALLPQATSATAPEHRRTLAFAAVGIPRSARFARVQMWLARLLYLAFLKKDFRIVEHMRLTTDGTDDPGVQAVAAYQSSLKDLETD